MDGVYNTLGFMEGSWPLVYVAGGASAGKKRAPRLVPGAVGCGLELGFGCFVADYGYVRMGLED